MAKELVTVEHVLRELQIDEKELERLIASGDLHPTGEGLDRRFDLDEVHDVKVRKEGYPTIPLPDLEDILDDDEEDEESD